MAALAADAALFPDGADAGYDGTQGTVDLAGADLSGYAVFVVPSLADGPDVQPYALLRNATIAARLKAAFMGRVAVWSGTPDVGSTNRAAKDELIRNLAGWAKAGRGGDARAGRGGAAGQLGRRGGAVRLAGGHLGAVGQRRTRRSRCTRTSQVLTHDGADDPDGSGGLQIGYTNMASFGLVSPAPARRATRPAGGRAAVVLVDGGRRAERSEHRDGEHRQGGLLAGRDRDRHRHGLGAGRDGEPGVPRGSVDPRRSPLTAVADENGAHLQRTTSTPKSPTLESGFILVATGQTSGRTAQTTFTDDRLITAATVNGGATTTVPAGITVTALR